MIATFCDPFIYKCTFRFESFAPIRDGKAAWFVDGCDYLGAIATAIDKVSQGTKILSMRKYKFCLGWITPIP